MFDVREESTPSKFDPCGCEVVTFILECVL